MLSQIIHLLIALTNNTNIGGGFAEMRSNFAENYVTPKYGATFRRNAEKQARSLELGGNININSNNNNVPVLGFGALIDCRTYLLKFGDNEVILSSTPKGFCEGCCPIKFTKDVLFVLYTKEQHTPGVLIAPILKAGAARHAGVKDILPTVIFVHGFTERSPGMSGKAIVDAYLSREEDYNVILVNWTELTAFPWYDTAVKNVKLVANMLKQFLEFYNDTGEIPIETVHLIGFSLGAQISSFVGKTLRKDLRVKRITGLDPAFPQFPLKDTAKRLTFTDAEYVDVIHTDSGILGFPMSVGHADFYPNGGRALQPGCQPSYLVQIRLSEHIVACSHLRAWKLYAESVRNPMAFPATKCKVWRGPNKKCDFKAEAYLGFLANKNTTIGQYYLLTKHKKPFARTAKEQIVA